LGLGELDAARAQVDGDADLRSVLESYSRIVGSLIAASARLSFDDLSNLIAAYMDMGHIKDRIARERSVGASWLLQDSPDTDLLVLFAQAHAEKTAFIESFRGHASKSQQRIFDEIVHGPILDEIERQHRRMLEGKLTQADADVWHRTHLALGDLVSRAEERMALDMEREIQANLAAAKTTFYGVVIVVVGLVVFSLETLRRSERRATLAQEEARKLSRAVEQSPVSVMITDTTGIVEYVNPAFTRMTGFSRDEMLGRNPRVLKSDQVAKTTYAELWHTIRAGLEWRGEIVNRRKDGTAYWEQMTIAPVKRDGKVINYIALKEDVTEVRTLRQSLEREHANIRRILEATHDGIALLSGNGDFEYANPALVAEFGPIDGRNCRDYFNDPDAPCPTCDLNPLGIVRREWRSRVTGKVYELTGSPVQNLDGSHSLLQVFHDITVRKQAEEALNGARVAAELANRAKSEFLATMSHELRTPLNAIIGFSEIIEGELLGPVGQPQYSEYARDINDSGRHLLQLINDILDVARLEVGRVTLREDMVDAGSLVRAGLNMVRERAEAADLALTATVAPGLPMLWADERRLKQVLVNLLGNAVKFTQPGGSIEASVRLAPDGGMEIAVSDTGIGIAPEDIPKIMAPFGQADSGMARRYEGSGLGLPLSRQLMELHGGTLTIDSQVGHGTTVSLHFPAERLRAATGERIADT
ncbi:MAG TPA: ATP-binding protein, partial [Candidatus Omnitrophota bacterium]|nr:ATP-binding protein [Candidatus Omnitrophota bacterium]